MAGAPDAGWPYVLLGGSGVGVRTRRYKLTWSRKESKLFDLREDPREQVELGERGAVARRACEVYLGEGLMAPAKRRRLEADGDIHRQSSDEVEIDEKLRQQLESLGYIQ